MNRYNDDPFENGWASEPSQAFGASSTFLTSLQLLTNSPPPPQALESIPAQYSLIYSKLQGRVNLDTDIRSHILTPLAEEGFLSSYQCTNIALVVHDHLTPVSAESNFVQILGLVALELQTPGTGDYVTLHYSLGSGLPELPVAAANVLLRASEEPASEPALSEPTFSQPFSDPLSTPIPLLSAPLADPLSSGPLGASLPTRKLTQWPEEPQGLLADQSALLMDISTTETAADESDIAKYVAEIRDRFQPLVGADLMVKIKEVPEKEGLLFKHVNYAITHELHLGLHGPSGPKKVVRRYSDFVWLLEFLLQKYPFRVTPGLPPKKFTGMCPFPVID